MWITCKKCMFFYNGNTSKEMEIKYLFRLTPNRGIKTTMQNQFTWPYVVGKSIYWKSATGEYNNQNDLRATTDYSKTFIIADNICKCSSKKPIIWYCFHIAVIIILSKYIIDIKLYHNYDIIFTYMYHITKQVLNTISPIISTK